MNDNGQSYVILAAGTLLGVLTIGMLGANSLYQLSPTLKTGMFLLLSLFLTLLGMYADRPLEYAIYIISFTSFIMVVYLGLSLSGLETNTHLLITSLGSVVFLGVGYIFQNDIINPERGSLIPYLALVLIALVLLAGYDLSGEKSRYNLITNEKPEIKESGDLKLGNMIVHNRFPFVRTVELPKYRACIYSSDYLVTEIAVQIEELRLIEGRTIHQLEATAVLKGELAELETEKMKIVRSSKCNLKNASNEIRISQMKTHNIRG